MSLFEKFNAEGEEKADELAEEGATLDEGFMAQARGSTIQKERGNVYAALQYAASFRSLVEEWKDCEELKPRSKEKLIFVDKKMEETKHQTEWCASAGNSQCMGCGRGSKYMKMQGTCAGPNCLVKYSKRKLGRMNTLHMGGHDMVRRVDRQGEILVWVQKMLW